MLGLSSGLIKGTSALRSIVKKGLQAWYKADKTQAPLGEEEIANGDFNEKGPDLIGGDMESFFAGSEGSKFSYDSGLTTVIGDSLKHVVKIDLLEHSKSYKVTIDVVTLAGISPKVYLGGSQSTALVEGVNVKYITTAASGDTGAEFIGLNDAEGLVFRDYKIERTDPGDSWSVANRTWTVEDGKVSHSQGSNDFQQCRQTNVIKLGKKYQVSYSIVDYTSGSVRVDLGDANQGTARNAVGDYSEIITNTGTQTFVDIEPVTGGSGTFVGAISNLSVREVTNSVKDFSPNVNNGVLYSGKCLHFDSSNYIDINYWASKTINSGTRATFATWFKGHDVASHPTDGTGRDLIFANKFSSGNNFFLGIINRKLELGWGSSGWTADNNSISVDSHTWYRVAVVVDGLTCRVYLNGELAFSKTNASAFTLHSDGISIGAQGDGVGEFLYGDLADFQIYDKAWTVSDVTYDWENPDKDVFDNSNSGITTTDCTALYRLNEGAGDRVYNAAPVLGEELVSNGNFDTDTAGWNEKLGDITYDSGALKFGPLTNNGSGGPWQNIGLEANKDYAVTLTMKLIESGGGSPKIGVIASQSNGGGQVAVAQGSSLVEGVAITETLYFTGIQDKVSIQPWTDSAVGTIFTVDNISVKEISLSESYVQENWVANRWITAQPYIPQYAMSSYSKKIIFDGVNDYVQLGTGNITVPAADPFSFSFWYYNIDESTDQPILGKSDSSSDYLILNDGDSGIAFRADNQAEVVLNFDTELTAGKLNHIVLTSAGGTGTMKCYLNGVIQADTGTSPNLPFDFRTLFRTYKEGAHVYGKGFMDELAYFSKELSETEVQEIFNGGMALDCRDHSAYLGSEIVDDGGFDDPLEWSIGTGWSVTGGRASVDGTDTALRQTLSVTQGKIYDLTFEISDYVKGAFQFGFNQFNIAGTSNNLPNFFKNGVYNYRVVALGNNIDVYMYGVNPSEFSIDNLSVREVQLNGYWRNNGADTWYDLSPYGNNGIVDGLPTTIQLQEVPYFKKDTFGLPMNKVRQKGLNFDGDGYVKVTHDASLGDMSDGFTCMFWYRHAEDIDANNWFHLVSKGTSHDASSVHHGFGTSSYNNKVYAHIRTSSGLYDVKHTISGASPKDPKWWHVAATYDGSGKTNTMKLYINGSEEDTEALAGSVTSTADAYPIMIGTNHDNSNNKRARGVIDEVKWYNRDLELKEIEKDYKATKSKHSSTSAWSDDFSDSFI